LESDKTGLEGRDGSADVLQELAGRVGRKGCEQVKHFGVVHTWTAVSERVLKDGWGDAVPPEERVERASKLFVALELRMWRDDVGSDDHVNELSVAQNEVNRVSKLVAALGTLSELKDYD
jgi:hypothetical protein